MSILSAPFISTTINAFYELLPEMHPKKMLKQQILVIKISKSFYGSNSVCKRSLSELVFFVLYFCAMLINFIYRSLAVLIIFFACSCTSSVRKKAEESFKQLITDNQRLVNDYPDSALTQINKGILLAQKQNASDTVLAYLYFQGANAWLFKNQYDSARHWLRLCLAHNTIGKTGEFKAKVYTRYGIIAWYEGNFTESLRFQKISLEESEKIKDSIGISSALNNIGIVYDRMGALANAADYHFKSLAIRQKTNDTTNISHSLVNLAIINQQLKNYPLALKQFLQAKEELPTRVPPFVISNVLTNIGHTYYLLNNYDSARHYQKQSYAIRKSIGNKLGQAACLQRLALVALAQQQPDTAMVYANKALQIQQKIRDKTGIVLTRQTLFKIYKSRNQLPLARVAAAEAYRLADSLKLWKIKAEIANEIVMAKIFPMIENVYWYEQLLATKDSLNDYESKRHLAYLESELETEKKDNRLRELAYQNKNQKADIRQRNVFILFGSCVLIVLIAAYLNLKKSKHILEITNRKVNKVNQLLDASKNSLRESLLEKEVLYKELQHRVKNNFQLIASLLQLQERSATNEADKKWIKEFKSRIAGMAVLHQKFYNSSKMERVNMQEYIDDLLQNLILVSGLAESEICIKQDVDTIKLPFGKAMAFGLLLNELFVNSLKYAKPADNLLIITVKYKRTTGNEVCLRFADNGKEFYATIKDLEPSVGFELIEALTQQLEGTCICRTQKGLQWIITHNINSTMV
jgi:two-component sensor histidine kinase